MSDSNQSTQSTQEKRKTVKCDVCKTKLIVMAYTCRCEKQYCITHLPAVEHACPFNYKGHASKVLSVLLDNSGLANKIDKI
jgi:hypothetical protein